MTSVEREFVRHFRPDVADKQAGDRRVSVDLSSSGGGQSYFATARIDRIERDPSRGNHYYAFVEGYLDSCCGISRLEPTNESASVSAQGFSRGRVGPRTSSRGSPSVRQEVAGHSHRDQVGLVSVRRAEPEDGAERGRWRQMNVEELVREMERIKGWRLVEGCISVDGPELRPGSTCAPS